MIYRALFLGVFAAFSFQSQCIAEANVALAHQKTFNDAKDSAEKNFVKEVREAEKLLAEIYLVIIENENVSIENCPFLKEFKQFFKEIKNLRLSDSNELFRTYADRYLSIHSSYDKERFLVGHESSNVFDEIAEAIGRAMVEGATLGLIKPDQKVERNYSSNDLDLFRKFDAVLGSIRSFLLFPKTYTAFSEMISNPVVQPLHIRIYNEDNKDLASAGLSHLADADHYKTFLCPFKSVEFNNTRNIRMSPSVSVLDAKNENQYALGALFSKRPPIKFDSAYGVLFCGVRAKLFQEEKVVIEIDIQAGKDGSRFLLHHFTNQLIKYGFFKNKNFTLVVRIPKPAYIDEDETDPLDSEMVFYLDHRFDAGEIDLVRQIATNIARSEHGGIRVMEQMSFQDHIARFADLVNLYNKALIAQ